MVFYEGPTTLNAIERDSSDFINTLGNGNYGIYHWCVGTSMPEEERKGEKPPTWLILVNEPLNKDADILIRWSRTSFFGGCPTSEPIVHDGVEYAMFMRCGDDWLMKYTLGMAITYFKHVKLFNNGQEVSVDEYAKDAPRPTGGILGDAATMGRSGGMC